MVRSIEEARQRYEMLSGERVRGLTEVPALGLRLAFVGGFELLEPLNSDSPVGRFLLERGPGLHHAAFRVEDISTSIATLKARGVRFLDDVPRMGADKRLIAFLHPESTGESLIELVQADATSPLSEVP